MSEKIDELELINHLLEVEKNASILVEEAKKEADAKKTEATAIFNKEYKSKYDSAMAEKKAEYESKINQINENHQKELQGFKEQLESKPVNKAAFTKLLDSLFFEKA